MRHRQRQMCYESVCVVATVIFCTMNSSNQPTQFPTPTANRHRHVARVLIVFASNNTADWRGPNRIARTRANVNHTVRNDRVNRKPPPKMCYCRARAQFNAPNQPTNPINAHHHQFDTIQIPEHRAMAKRLVSRLSCAHSVCVSLCLRCALLFTVWFTFTFACARAII